MKILHLTEFFAPVGGLEQYLFAVCGAMCTAGLSPQVIYGTRLGREPMDAGFPTTHIPGIADPAPLPDGTLERLRAYLAEQRADIAVVHEVFNPAVLNLLTSALPTIRFVHGHKLACPGGRRLWARRKAICSRPVGLTCQALAYRERCMPRNPLVGIPLIRRTQALVGLHHSRGEMIAPSGFVRELLLRNQFNPEQVHVVPYFTDLPRDPAPERDIVDGRIFCAARLTPEKGVDHLIRALVALPPPAHLVIGGAGPFRTELESLARHMQVAGRIHFLGWLDRAGIVAAIRNAAIVAVPSVWPETFGIVGIEAMAHARPVVAYDAGGVREWLEQGRNGLLVPFADQQALSRALQSLLGDSGSRQAFGREGRLRVEQRFLATHHLAGFAQVAERARARWERSVSRTPGGHDSCP